MLSSRLRYGAAHAKIMGLYGKRLKAEDWERLYDCGSVQEVFALLKGQKGWGPVLTHLPAAPDTRQLEAAVRSRIFEEYDSLNHFLLGEDRACLALFGHRAEHDILIQYLGARHGLYQVREPALTEFIQKSSRLSLTALESGKSFADVLEAVRGSIYEKSFSKLLQQTAGDWPDYMLASALIENTYFTAVFSYFSKKYQGPGKKRLEQLVGLEADLLNLVSELRLQRSFRSSLKQSRELLVPLSYKLKPALLTALEKAGSEAEAMELLRRSPFGPALSRLERGNIEQVYYDLLEKFCKKLIRGAEPDISLVFAYLILKELECKKLIRLIEAIQKGYKPRGLI